MSDYSNDNVFSGWGPDDDRVRWETAEERARAGWLDEQRLDRRDRDLPVHKLARPRSQSEGQVKSGSGDGARRNSGVTPGAEQDSSRAAA